MRLINTTVVLLHCVAGALLFSCSSPAKTMTKTLDAGNPLYNSRAVIVRFENPYTTYDLEFLATSGEIYSKIIKRSTAPSQGKLKLRLTNELGESSQFLYQSLAGGDVYRLEKTQAKLLVSFLEHSKTVHLSLLGLQKDLPADEFKPLFQKKSIEQ